jgi:hypothetical protein
MIKELIKEKMKDLNLMSTYFNIRYHLFFLFKVDFSVVSHPKAGRTWLRMLLANAFKDMYNSELTLDTHEIGLNNSQVPRIYFTHSTSDFHSRSGYKPPNFNRYTTTPVIFLARDPRDMSVSYFHEVVDRDAGTFEGSLSDFIRSDRYGIKNTIRFLNEWLAYLKSKEERGIILRYEDMQADTELELEKALSFFGVSVDDDVLSNAVEKSKFDRMKKMEKNETINDHRLSPTDKKKENTYKVRKGQIGGFAEELNQKDISFVNSALQDLNSEFGYSVN